MKKNLTIFKVIKQSSTRGVLYFSLHQLKNIIRSPRRLRDYKKIIGRFANKYGIEIGGPSQFFGRHGLLPIYQIASSVDNLNFSSVTLWTGSINKKSGYIVNGKIIGRQYITDAIDCHGVGQRRYDFVLSCNSLEHIANPLRAVKKWSGLLRRNGLLLIVVPRKESNFDHRRAVVEFEHLITDYKNNTGECDMKHLAEILKLHDLRLDLPAGTSIQFKKRSEANLYNRCLHHHVFDESVLCKIYKYFDLSILNTITTHTDYIIIGKKKAKR